MDARAKREKEMLDRWFYKHNGKIGEPVTLAGLQVLADRGEISPTDLIWPDGKRPADGIHALNAVNFPSHSSSEPAAPDWLDNLSAAEGVEVAPSPSTVPGNVPDWLADVEQAEHSEPRGPDRAVRIQPRAPRRRQAAKARSPENEAPAATPTMPAPGRSRFVLGVVVGVVGTLLTVGAAALAAWLLI
jgi:hypothetical protein